MTEQTTTRTSKEKDSDDLEKSENDDISQQPIEEQQQQPEEKIVIVLKEQYYKLDWHDINSRIRQIVLEMQQELKVQTDENQENVKKTLLNQDLIQQDIQAIHEAVFINSNKVKGGAQPMVNQRNNVFYNFMRDATNLKTSQMKFESELEQRIEAIERKTEYLTINSKQLQDTVKSYEIVLLQQIQKFSEFRDSEQECRIQAESRHGVTLKRMYDELQLMSQSINGYDLRTKNLELKMFETQQVVDQLNKIVHHSLNEVREILNIANVLREEKLEKSEYEQMRTNLQTQIDMINKNLDIKESNIKAIESFTDRYIPIRILHTVRDAFQACFPRSQLLKYESYERKKLKDIHEHLLKEEQIPSIFTIIKDILFDINRVIEQYRLQAEQMGQKFDLQFIQAKGQNSQNVSLDQVTDGTEKTLKSAQSAADLRSEIVYSFMQPSQSTLNERATHQQAELLMIDGPYVEPELEQDQNELDQEQIIEMEKERQKKNKIHLFKWIVEADFCNEFNLVDLACNPFMLDKTEEQITLNQEAILKLFKILAYKIGLSFKRQDIVMQEIKESFSQQNRSMAVKQDAVESNLTQSLQQLYTEIEDQQTNLSQFKQDSSNEVKNLKLLVIESQDQSKEMKKRIEKVGVLLALHDECHNITSLVDKPVEQEYKYRGVTLLASRLHQMRKLIYLKCSKIFKELNFLSPEKVFNDMLALFQQQLADESEAAVLLNSFEEFGKSLKKPLEKPNSFQFKRHSTSQIENDHNQFEMTSESYYTDLKLPYVHIQQRSMKQQNSFLQVSSLPSLPSITSVLDEPLQFGTQQNAKLKIQLNNKAQIKHIQARNHGLQKGISLSKSVQK